MMDQKSEATNSWHNSVKFLTDFHFFFTRRILGKFAVKWLLKVQSLLVYAATLLCETLMSENKQLTINYKTV